jgi:hypothetical protein
MTDVAQEPKNDRAGAPHPAWVVVGALLVLSGIALVVLTGTDSRSSSWPLEGVTWIVAAVAVLLGAILGGGKSGRVRMLPVFLVLPIFLRAALKSGALKEILAQWRTQVRPWVAALLLVVPAAVFMTKPLYAPIEVPHNASSAADDPYGDMPPGLRRMLEEGPPPGEAIPADAPPELLALMGRANAAQEPETFGYFSETHLYFVGPGMFFAFLGLLVLALPARRKAS